MNPQPSPYKKFLLPGLIIIALVVIGLLLFLKDGAVDQGAALFTGVTKTSSLRAVPPIASNCRPTVGANGLPVAPAPSVKVTTPNGGETFMAGQQITVNWTKCNFSSPVAIILAYYPAGSVNFTRAKNLLSSGTGLTPNDGSEVVTLSTAASLIANGSQFGAFYKILITNGLSPQTATLNDASDNLFTIQSSNTNAVITYNDLLGMFQVGETVTGLVSGAMHAIVMDNGNTLSLNTITTPLIIGDTITGSSSGATASVIAVTQGQ